MYFRNKQFQNLSILVYFLSATVAFAIDSDDEDGSLNEKRPREVEMGEVIADESRSESIKD